MMSPRNASKGSRSELSSSMPAPPTASTLSSRALSRVFSACSASSCSSHGNLSYAKSFKALPTHATCSVTQVRSRNANTLMLFRLEA